ncbi:uncharacterized protein LOC120659989 isoform X2 [Panicum virgatum]|uniref:uncharacterized protein LOC120659989 isoform X2 n=1 Tax=Panicum virgatum TaxID=38727 RepID=UPI0019D63721|nr:uncharacterized protein LOC120659989 isoform X2 [Panicum virgatum]
MRYARGRRPRRCRCPLLTGAPPPHRRGPRAASIYAARAASFTPLAQVLAAPPRLLHAAVRLALLRCVTISVIQVGGTVEERIELAEQFAPSNQGFIQTMNKVFEHAGDLINIRVAHNLMRLIAEGFGEDEGADSQLRSSAI